ncbi:hypothetical protein N9W17_04285 [Jannaschia sp.]|nr:hypothetical protein [Jannaschia sp.]
MPQRSGCLSTLWALGGLAVAQIVMQLRYVLSIGSGTEREDSHLLLFSLLLAGLMAGGTIWSLSDLYGRTF